jgi:hypothetical protein
MNQIIRELKRQVAGEFVMDDPFSRMQDPAKRAERYQKVAEEYADLAKDASSPFLRAYYQRTAEEYRLRAGKLRALESGSQNFARPRVHEVDPPTGPAGYRVEALAVARWRFIGPPALHIQARVGASVNESGHAPI